MTTIRDHLDNELGKVTEDDLVGQTLRRLDVLCNKLDRQGLHVSVITLNMAIKTIRHLRGRAESAEAKLRDIEILARHKAP